MGKWEVRTCCGCFSLRFGAFLVAVVGIAGAAFLLTVSAIFLGHSEFRGILYVGIGMQ